MTTRRRITQAMGSNGGVNYWMQCHPFGTGLATVGHCDELAGNNGGNSLLETDCNGRIFALLSGSNIISLTMSHTVCETPLKACHHPVSTSVSNIMVLGMSRHLRMALAGSICIWRQNPLYAYSLAGNLLYPRNVGFPIIGTTGCITRSARSFG